MGKKLAKKKQQRRSCRKKKLRKQKKQKLNRKRCERSRKTGSFKLSKKNAFILCRETLTRSEKVISRRRKKNKYPPSMLCDFFSAKICALKKCLSLSSLF